MENKPAIKVSVILPVYGVAEFIEACTRSLLNQTLNEVEYLFVDDHGPDNSIELAKKVIEDNEKASQFHFLRPESNLGAGMARNYAIPMARGEYIAFVDSDDTIEPTMLEELYSKAASTHADLCCCKLQKYDLDGTPGEVMGNPMVGDGELTHERRATALTNYVSLFSTFLYRREYLTKNNILFPEDRSADDSYFISCAWMTAASIAYVDKPLYRYLIRPGSVTTTKNSTKYEKRLRVFAKMMQYAKAHGVYDEFADEIDFVYIKKGFISSVVNYAINSSAPEATTIKKICNELHSQVPQYKKNQYLAKNKKMKLLVSLIHTCPKFAASVLDRYAKRNNIVS